jgi:hypothetical protein
VKHAGSAALAALAPLLEELRGRPSLREDSPGVFYWKSRAFLHFHEDPGGLYADVRLGADFTRLPVTSSAQRSALLQRIDRHLSEQAVEERP